MLPRAVGARELLDAPAPLPELEKNLRDLARLNRFFGGSWLVRAYVARLAERLPSTQPITILDVGTGGADIPVALVRWGRQHGRRLRLVAIDTSRQVLSVARGRTASYREIDLVQGDGRRLPLKTGGVDVALLSLTLHHFEPDEAASLLGELNRVSRLGFIVNDLVRSRLAYCLVWLATRLFAWSRMARHDGPLSVFRAYTPDEIRELAQRVPLNGIRIVRYPWLSRVVAVVEKV